MKTLRFILAFLVLALTITSCQKDFSFEGGNAKGSLGKTTAGDCDPIFVNGIYYKDTTLKSSNFVDVQVDFTKIGLYTIKTDTINGYSFSAVGNTGTLGINTIRLFGKGKPLAPGFDIFTVKYDGSQCSFTVSVASLGTGGGGAAVFSFGGSPGTCSGAVPAGSYTSGVAMTAANTVTIPVTVTTAGTYNITTAANGVTFSGSGTLTTASTSIVLAASGATATSATQVVSNYPITSGTSNCSFDITYAATPAGGPAVFTFNCGGSSPNIQGTYAVGIATNSATNYIDIPILVSTPGSYGAINLTPITTGYGFTFSNPGGVLTAGQTTIRFTASGTPTTAAYSSFAQFNVSYGTPASTCGPITVPVAYGDIKFSVNGGPIRTFNINQSSVNAAVAPPLTGFNFGFYGEQSIASNTESINVDIFKPSAFTATTYDANSLISGISLDVTYTDALNTDFNILSSIPAPMPGFTVNIITLTPNRAIGTFSGTLKSMTGTPIVITSGEFNLPL